MDVERLVAEYLVLSQSDNDDEYERSEEIFETIRDRAAREGFDVYRRFPEIFIGRLMMDVDDLSDALAAAERRIEDLEEELHER